MIAPSASSVEVYTQGYKYLFGTFTPNETLTEPLSKIASELSDPPKTVAIISRNDLFPLAIGNCAKDSAEKYGMDVVYFEKYPIGVSDFSPLLIQVKGKNPDWVFATGYAEDLILIKRQMKELDSAQDGNNDRRSSIQRVRRCSIKMQSMLQRLMVHPAAYEGTTGGQS